MFYDVEQEMNRVGADRDGNEWVGTYELFTGKHIAVITDKARTRELAIAAVRRFISGPSNDYVYRWKDAHPDYANRCCVVRQKVSGDEIVRERT
jgi:hypothetical protein